MKFTTEIMMRAFCQACSTKMQARSIVHTGVGNCTHAIVEAVLRMQTSLLRAPCPNCLKAGDVIQDMWELMEGA